MELYEAIRGRRTVRCFSSNPIPKETLERVIDAANWAPSPLNSQPWSFILVTGQKRDELVEIIKDYTSHLQDAYKDSGMTTNAEMIESTNKFAQDLGGAPVLIVVTVPRTHAELWQTSIKTAATIACQNLMLAAYAEGLGTVYLTSSLFMEQQIKEYLSIPHDDIIVVIPIGFWSDLPPSPGRKPANVEWLGFD